jgi:hypothetical protein
MIMSELERNKKQFGAHCPFKDCTLLNFRETATLLKTIEEMVMSKQLS